jgi:acetoin utilization protein AcuB
MGSARDEILVTAVMTERLVTVAANASLAEARDLLQQHGIHHLLVMHEQRVVAVLSDRDVLRSISPYVGTLSEQTRDMRSLLRPVFQLASYHPITVSPAASVLEAAALMLDHAISCLPVVDAHGDTVGVVTSRDLLRGVLACALPSQRDAPPLSESQSPAA